MTYRRFTAIALGLAIVALVAIGVLTSERVDQLADTARGAASGRAVTGSTGALLSALGEAESAHRGFLLSGDEEDLEAYRAAQSQVSQRLEALRTTASTDPSQASIVDEVARAVDVSRGRMAESVTARRDHGFAVLAALDAHRRARAANARVRSLGAGLLNAERQTLAARERATAEHARTTRWLIIAAFVVAVAASIFAGSQVRRELRGWRIAEHAARSAYREVDERIRERTRELSDLNERLRSSEAQFRVIAEVSPVHLFTNAPDGAATYVSPGFSALTGLSPDRVLGFGWAEALHPDDRGPVITTWQAAIKSARHFQSDFRVRQVSGGYRWFKVRVVPVRDAQGELVQWVGAAADIHEQQESLEARAVALRREQQARQDAERANRLKDDFLGTVSHELRTPLNAIVGWAHVLRTGILDPDETRRAVEAIERNARVQTRVVDDLLDVARMIRGGLTLNVAPCDLGGVVRDVLETLEPAAAAKHLSLDADLDDADVIVSGDADRLKQVVWNLVSNAVKFTPKNGRVSIEVKGTGSRAILKIADSGEGIDEAFLPHVFDPFRQGDSRSMRAGLGLGLAIVREIVTLHGGAVTAESLGAGRGAVFTVTLPLNGTGLARSSTGSEAQSLVGVRVLVAEGDEESATALSTLLSHNGCNVRTVATAGEFLSALVQWHPQVLVCDVGLPDEDGYSLLRRVRAIDGFAAVPAIALTGHARDEDRSRALSAGYRAHLSKPLNAEALIREIGAASLIEPVA
ncbi:MAG: ATP-binding protein [Vicinamibacterales bacterium]